MEKSIRKLGFVSSLEASFYRERHLFADSIHFQHPPCHALIDTPWESLIFIQFVEGKAPHLHAIAEKIARGIAEIESVSRQHLRDSSRIQGLKHWRMDFFRLWYLLRPRFNFSRLLPSVRALATQDTRFAGLEAQLRPFIAQVRENARAAQRSPRCYCHMDYLRKNLFVSEQGLHLIDWSEVKVGRVGFDGGAYLSAVFRRNNMLRFRQVSEEFLTAYSQALTDDADRSLAIANVRYVFLLNSLWYCMRPQTIAEYSRTENLNELREKFEYLLTLKVV
ncbi:phosphotransferase [Pseudomonas syringae]|uniref:Phosphotransferase n=1 Tax=Pseudomonas syringae TaxID=317 RepID=A0A085VQD2_PSESX|nr:phosphotransferase [Pseudomonas syringae]